jgi:aminoglycoside phosphotransferase family enzyme/predicted kinase
VDHATLVEALKDPSFYPHPVDAVELIQTHISSVFLTGQYVYKLKKPVNFGFLDFSTVGLRHRYCEAELELNFRLAPSVYLRVAPLTLEGGKLAIDGAGEIVDWVVVMRQMDGERLGPQVLESGELGVSHIDALLDKLVPFYRDAATGPGIDEYGDIEGVRFNTDENFNQTHEFVDKALSKRRFDNIRAFTNRFYDANAELFQRRIDEGRIRESHGDLHLRNIFFQDEPVIFDCIEFNERFRCGDVAVDLAFLAMDLDFRGRPELAEHLINGYVERSGDRELPKLIDFYRCYRAYVRGKIACFTYADPGLDEEARQAQLDLARRYFRLAHQYAGGGARPRLVVLFGLMGAGKSSLSRYLGQELEWTVLSSDAIRKQLAGVGETTRVWVPYNEGLYSPEMTRRTYNEMCRRAESLLTGDLPVVMDGCFKTNNERRLVIDVAERTGAELLFVQTTCEDEEQWRRLERRRRLETASDGRVELIESQKRDFEPPPAGYESLFSTMATDGPREETRANMKAFLEERGFLEE